MKVEEELNAHRDEKQLQTISRKDSWSYNQHWLGNKAI